MGFCFKLFRKWLIGRGFLDKECTEEVFLTKALNGYISNTLVKMTDEIKALELELASTKKMLDEAKEVIGFYADITNWDSGNEYWDYENIITGHDLEIECHHGKDIHIGGKRAREFLAKHEKKGGA